MCIRYILTKTNKKEMKNGIKKQIEDTDKKIFCNVREIWWCSIGENVGVEFRGKNELFERPVLILKVFNQYSISVLPLTSKIKDGKYYTKVVLENTISYGNLSQVKLISTKRLTRKVGRIFKKDFQIILENFKNIF